MGTDSLNVKLEASRLAPDVIARSQWEEDEQKEELVMQERERCPGTAGECGSCFDLGCTASAVHNAT